MYDKDAALIVGIPAAQGEISLATRARAGKGPLTPGEREACRWARRRLAWEHWLEDLRDGALGARRVGSSPFGAPAQHAA